MSSRYFLSHNEYGDEYDFYHNFEKDYLRMIMEEDQNIVNESFYKKKDETDSFHNKYMKYVNDDIIDKTNEKALLNIQEVTNNFIPDHLNKCKSYPVLLKQKSISPYFDHVKIWNEEITPHEGA